VAAEQGKPDLSGRKMARGDEWRYAERRNQKQSEHIIRSSRMVSKEAPDFITRVAEANPSKDFGHSHPYSEGAHTTRLRDASVQKGCGKKCTWLRSVESKETPFNTSSARVPQKGRRPQSAPPLRPPYAVSVLQHGNDFNKSSTKHQLGKQATNRFYNSIGGWSAARN